MSSIFMEASDKFPAGWSYIFMPTIGETLQDKPKKFLLIDEIKAHIKFVRRAEEDLQAYFSNEIYKPFSGQTPPTIPREPKTN